MSVERIKESIGDEWESSVEGFGRLESGWKAQWFFGSDSCVELSAGH